MARLLDLRGEGHDREELGLRLRQRLAGPDGAHVEALEVGVDGVRGAPPVGDRLDDRRRAGADVAGAEDARPARLEGDRVDLEAPLLRLLEPLVAGADPGEVGPLADREQDAVALDDELGARRRLGPPPPGRVRGAQLHPDELHARDLPGRLVDEDARRAGLEDRGDALLDGLVDLARGRHVLHVAAVDERHLGGVLADGRPRRSPSR